MKGADDRIVAARVGVPIRQSHGTTKHNKRFKTANIQGYS